MKLRIGIVGCGDITRQSHLPILKSLKKVEVAALCDQRISVAKELALKFGVKNVFSDISEMLNKEKLDVVDICTPIHNHASSSIQAMEAGCHVLVEKPMAMSVEDAERMIHSSEIHGVKLCVVHQNLFNQAVVKARHLVEAGAVGDILNVNVQSFLRRDFEACLNERHWSHSLPGGIFFEFLSHPIYLLQSFLKNAEPIHILSRKVGKIKWIAKDELRVSVEAKNGLGSILASCNSLIHGDTLDIIGTRTALSVDLWGRTVIVYKPHTESSVSVGLSNLHLGMQLFKTIGTTASTFVNAIYNPIKISAHYAFISRFIDSLLNGTNPPTTGEDGRKTVEMLETICRQV